MKEQTLEDFRAVPRDAIAIIRVISSRRRFQLLILLGLQLVGAVSEVVSLGAVLPFLGALTNADQLLADPDFRPWLDLAGIATARELVAVSATLFALTAIFVNGLRVLTLWAQGRLAAAIGSDLSIEAYRRTLYQPYEYHTTVNSSTLISNLINDLRGIISALDNTMMICTQGLVVVFIAAALLAYNASIAASVGLITGAAYLLIVRAGRARLFRNGHLISDYYARLVKIQQEALGGIRDVLLDRSQPVFTNEYADADRPMRRAGAENKLIMGAPRYFLEAIGIATLCGLTAVLVWTSGEVQSLLPLLGAVALAANRLLPAAQQCYAAYSSISATHVSVRRILTTLEMSLDPTATAEVSEPMPVERCVQLEHVSFCYGTAGLEPRWVLKDINVDVSAKKTIALVGDTGSGKSTIADVLLGLLRPQWGALLIDGVPLDDTGLAAWRQSVAHVPQSIYLSDASIAENIAFGVPKSEIDMDRVREVARIARIAEFADALPDGLDTHIGERGIRLSGGQRQRIGIARAIYKHAQLIVFDEATSSLDSNTEREIMKAIENVARETTVVLIAHRLSTIKKADIIYEIAGGEVINSGSFADLMKRSSSFRMQARSSFDETGLAVGEESNGAQ